MAIDINAPNFSATLFSGYGLTDLVNFVKERFTAAGFGDVLFENSGTPYVLVYELILAPVATARIYFIVEVSQTLLRFKLYYPPNYNTQTFTAVNNTGANTNVGSTINLTGVPLQAYIVPSGDSELFGVVFTENGSFKGFAGIHFPLFKEAWYSDNWVSAGLIHCPTPNSMYIPYPNPGGNSGVPIGRRSQLSTFGTRNPVNNKPQLLKNFYSTIHSWGIDSRFGDDVVIVNSTGLQTNEILVIEQGIEEYWIAYAGDNGVAIRINV